MKIRVLVRNKRNRTYLQLYYVNPLTGREESKSAKTAVHKDALRAAAVWETELAASHNPSHTDWEGFRRRFESEHAASLSVKTQSSYGSALNHFEKLIGKPRDLSAITASVVSEFKGKLRDTGMEETSIATHLGHFRSALKWAGSVGMIAIVPVIKVPKTGKRRLSRGRALKETEFKAMLAAVPAIVGENNAKEWIRLLRGLYLGGMRIEESLRLSWDSAPCRVDLDGGQFPRIIWFIEGHKARRDEVTTITPDFDAFLRKTPPNKRTGPVFSPQLDGWTMNAKVARKNISLIGEKAGVIVNDKGKFASAQDLRRSFGTRWAIKVMPATLKSMMRHADISTTLKYYVDLNSLDVGSELWGVPKSIPTNGFDSKKEGAKQRRKHG